MYILDLNKDLILDQVGGKAASLALLIKYGVKVPPGFVLTKKVLIDSSVKNQFPEGFQISLKEKLKDLKTNKLIVRSSAIGEDSATHSFAGQLDSFVVQNNNEAIEEAIFKCWGSLGNERVKAYETISNKRLTEMGVVIQEFIEADYAGVTFTESPTDQKMIYTEFVKGAGEQLVSGQVTPKNFSTESENNIIELPFNAKKLISQSLDLKKQYDCHLDIEWVAKGAEIYFVQARPITVHKTNKIHWTNTNLNENYPNPISPLLYSIARDSYYHYFKNLSSLLGINNETIRTLEYDFSNTVGIWSNRIYYNMTSIHNVMSSSPLKDYFKTAFNQFVGYSDKDVAVDTNSKKTSLYRIIKRLIGLNFKLEKHVKEIENKVSNFSKKVNNANSEKENTELFYEFLDLRFNQWYRASLADFFSMIHYKLLGKITQKFYGKESVGVHNTLIQAIPGLISGEPLNDTWDLVEKINNTGDGRHYFLNNNSKEVYETIINSSKWSEINKMVQNYIHKWGFRCSGELMFFNENYAEKPERFIELLQSYMKNKAQNPRIIIAQKDKERREAMKKFALKILKKRHILIPVSLFEIGKLYLVAKLCKQGISSRERVRYKQAEMYYKFKVVVKKIGQLYVEKGILNNADDILYLSYKEIGELISSSKMNTNNLSNDLEERKRLFDIESNNSFPNDFTTEFGQRPESIKANIELVEGATEFYGLAASGGRIKARVKVLQSVLEGEKIEKGDILVTKQTDPGWAMVFPLIGGLIVERGGALSHGAIVAREFGIPAVLGVENIVEILKDNDEVILDGDLGKIQLLND
jgi:phosphoenolpyruvate synthase/pyruvate phosphate dikinase